MSCENKFFFSYGGVHNSWLKNCCQQEQSQYTNIGQVYYNLRISSFSRGCSAVVARSLCMWKAQGSIPGISIGSSYFFLLSILEQLKYVSSMTLVFSRMFLQFPYFTHNLRLSTRYIGQTKLHGIYKEQWYRGEADRGTTKFYSDNSLKSVS